MNRPEIWTARISTKDKDAFNVTWKSGERAFAPSIKILGPMLDIRREGRAVSDAEWKAYVLAYAAEMKQSYAKHRYLWDELLARDRVVLTCYCNDSDRCHRTVLARILARLGGTFCGELAARDREGEADFDLAMKLGED